MRRRAEGIRELAGTCIPYDRVAHLKVLLRFLDDLAAGFLLDTQHFLVDLTVGTEQIRNHVQGWDLQGSGYGGHLPGDSNRKSPALRLKPGTTKNDEGRLVYFTPELKALLAAQLERIRAVERKTERIIPFLFPYLSDKTRLGQRRRDFSKVWAATCKAAGVAGMHHHDFRRTAVRNMVNAGVARRVAMKVTSHKTRAVFDR